MPHRGYWFVLAAIFVVLSLDEYAGIHERAEYFIGRATGLSFSLAWAISGGLIVGAVFLASVGFLRALPGSTATAFVLAGTVFVSGARAVATVGAMTAEAAGRGAARRGAARRGAARRT